MSLADAIGAQWWNLQVGAKILDPFHGVVGTGCRAARQEARDFVKTVKLLRTPTFSHGTDVYFRCMGQERGADGTVGRVKHAANRRGKAMDCAKAGVGEGHAAEQTRHAHVFT